MTKIFTILGLILAIGGLETGQNYSYIAGVIMVCTGMIINEIKKVNK